MTGSRATATGIVPLAEALADHGAWSDLANVAVEPSPFIGPDMIAAAAGTIEPADWRVARLVGADGGIEALLPFRRVRAAPVFGPRILEAFWSHYAPRTPPLVHADRPGALRGLVSLLGAEGDVLRLPYQAVDGPVAVALADEARSDGRFVRCLDLVDRAVLDAAAPQHGALGPGLKGERLRDLRRKERRLAERGHLVRHLRQTPEETAEALDAFIRLEAASWRGRGGTGLAGHPGRLAFARRFTAAMAAMGRFEADSLEVDGAVLGVLLTLRAGGEAFTWKVAHDETLAAHSPGTLVVWQATERFLDDPAILRADSLAVPDHPVMDRYWAGRMRIGTMILATRPEGNAQAARAAAAHARYLRLRATLKTLRDRLRR